MSRITLKGETIDTIGRLPELNSKAPDFTLTSTDLTERSLQYYKNKKIILNIFPSVDTGVCAASVRKFNEKAASLPGSQVLCVSADLPFAHSRFCGAEGIDNVHSLSCFRHPEFGEDFGVTIMNGPLRGLLSRAVVVINEQGLVVYTEQVPEIGQEPDYEAAYSLTKEI